MLMMRTRLAEEVLERPFYISSMYINGNLGHKMAYGMAVVIRHANSLRCPKDPLSRPRIERRQN